MTNAPGTRGREPFEDAGGHAEAEPLFPSEGTFSAVVPLSQVREERVAADDSATASDPTPEKSDEEATLVPTRLSPAQRTGRAATRDAKTKRGSRHWLATAAAVLLSVTAGVAAGAYMVWTRQARPPVTRAADVAPPTQPAPQAAPTEPTQATATDTPKASAPSAEVVKVEREDVAKTPAEVGKPEPAPRREAESERHASESEQRASRRARAHAETADAAPKPARAASAPRRQASPARTRPNTTAAAGRTLPVSSPPPTSRSRTVIQWP